MVEQARNNSPQHNFPRSVPAKLLLVDDDPGTVHTLSDTLQQRLVRHFTITTCETGMQALECVTGTRYDTIISDARPLGLTGLELLTSVRHIQPHTPFVLMSGSEEQEMIAHAIDAGASDFITKPIDREIFLFTIRQTLHLSRLLALLHDQDARMRRSRDGYWRAFKRLEQSHQPSMSVFRKRMTRHLTRLDAFLVKANETHQRTAKDLTTVRETLRGLAFSRLKGKY
jgi:response regulator RpfG family c-di-GMP phosphodiesterase